MKPTIEQLKNLLDQVNAALGQLDLAAQKQHLNILEDEIAKPDFWNDQTEAERISTEAASLRRYIEGWESLEGDL